MNTILKKKLEDNRLYFDGGMGSELAKFDLSEEEQQCSALVSLYHPEQLCSVHRRYLEAGCDIVTANTFTANPIKAGQYGFDLKEAIQTSIALAKDTVFNFGVADKLVALDIGPSGKMLEPFGPCPFEEIYEFYRKIVQYGEAAGADLILFETFADLYELKAGILAAKENSSLPVLATMTLEKNLHTLTGSSPEIIAAVLEDLGAEACGFNCSLGPVQMIEPVKALLKAAQKPVIVQPNAGLPKMVDGKPAYDIDAEEFSNIMAEMAKLGVAGLGGCCGTTPEHIRKVVEKTKQLACQVLEPKKSQMICSYQQAVSYASTDNLDTYTIQIKKSSVDIDALENGDYSEISDLAFEALDEESDAIVLDVVHSFQNPEQTVAGILMEVQSMIKLPILLHSSQSDVIKAYQRRYIGKGLVV